MATAKKAAAKSAARSTSASLPGRAPIVRRPAPARESLAPQYEVLQESFIDNRIVREGEKIEYYGVPGRWLKPLNAAAKANKAAAAEVRRDNRGQPEAAAEALRELDNELQGVETGDDFEDGEDAEELSEAERAALEQHVKTMQQNEASASADNTNKVSVQLTGDPTDPEGKRNPGALQGNTPVLDAKGGK